MPHFPKPFFKKKRRVWYVEIDRVQHNLGPDREKAFELYHELMTQARPPEQKPEVSPQSVIALIDKYLGWCERHRAPDTYRWYKDRLLVFIDDGLPGDLAATALKPFHLQEWIDRMEGVSDGTRRNYCRAVQRVYSWAEKLGYIERSPIAHFEKPPGGKRDVVISDEVFSQMLANIAPRQDGYYFREFDPNSPFLALGRLRGRIRHALATRHLEERSPGTLLPLHDTLRGRVSYSSEQDEAAFVIDGKFVTLSQFAKIVETYEGWQFRLDFIEEGEELR